MGQITMCNVNGVNHSDKPTDIITKSAVPLRYTESFIVFKLIALVLQVWFKLTIV